MSSPRSAYWGWHGFQPGAWIALLTGVVVSLLTINAPVFEGPVSEWLAGADLTWTLGPLTERCDLLGDHAAQTRGRRRELNQRRRSSRARATAAARVSASSLR